MGGSVLILRVYIIVSVIRVILWLGKDIVKILMNVVILVFVLMGDVLIFLVFIFVWFVRRVIGVRVGVV